MFDPLNLSVNLISSKISQKNVKLSHNKSWLVILIYDTARLDNVVVLV